MRNHSFHIMCMCLWAQFFGTPIKCLKMCHIFEDFWWFIRHEWVYPFCPLILCPYRKQNSIIRRRSEWLRRRSEPLEASCSPSLSATSWLRRALRWSCDIGNSLWPRWKCEKLCSEVKGFKNVCHLEGGSWRARWKVVWKEKKSEGEWVWVREWESSKWREGEEDRVGLWGVGGQGGEGGVLNIHWFWWWPQL